MMPLMMAIANFPGKKTRNKEGFQNLGGGGRNKGFWPEHLPMNNARRQKSIGL